MKTIETSDALQKLIKIFNLVSLKLKSIQYIIQT